jgi:hypothetical protein
MSTIKNSIWLVLIIGLIAIPAVAQKRRPETSRATRASRPSQKLSASERAAAVPSKPAQSLSPTERATALDTSLSTTCAETAPAAPRALAHDANVFSPQRIANTLHGVWIGKVSGEHDPQLFAADGFLNVDYYMVVDVIRGEAFTYQEFTSRRSGAALQAAPGAPKWTYVWCARQNYETTSPRQVHELTKVSNNVQDARTLITNSTGLTFAPGEEIVLSNVWQRLVAIKFFDDPNRSVAYAGVLFDPVTMGTVQSGGGGFLFELRFVGEYRGSGQTAAEFAPGQPIHNVEQGHFLGISGPGDFLVASFGLGNPMIGPKSDFDAPPFSTQMAFDKVVMGPLGPSPPVYKTGGGGKFTTTGTSGAPVSTLRFDAGSTADTGTASSFIDANSINGSLRAFNYSSRTLIESTDFLLLQGTVSANEQRVSGRARALVNSVQTNITFEVVKIAGMIRFEIRNADTNTILAGGTGEAGRATFDLAITGPVNQTASTRSRLQPKLR